MPRYNEPPTALEMELMTRFDHGVAHHEALDGGKMRKYRICPDCGYQWWISETCQTPALHQCKNGNMVVYPEPGLPSTEAHPNPVLRSILSNYFRGVYNQEETVNLILKEVGYGVSIGGGSPCKDGTKL